MKFLCAITIFMVAQVCLASSFKTPKGLEKDVRFWKLVFGKYHSGECVLHDPERLDMIYGVVKISHSSAKRKRKIAKYKNHIASYLQKIATGQPVSGRFARALYRAIPKDLRRASFLKTASRRIRCQRGNADGFRKSVVRSRSILPTLKKRMRANGLPEDLAYLPHVESRFNAKAYSKVGASGLWQLMPASARETGLKVTRWRDDRSSIYKSTTAAIKILRRNYQKVGSWPLALTGYNYGINGVARGVRKLGTKDYVRFRNAHDSPSFGFAGRNFYPSFLAVVSLAKKGTRKETSGLFF